MWKSCSHDLSTWDTCIVFFFGRLFWRVPNFHSSRYVDKMDHSRNCIFAQYNNLMTHFLSFHMWAPQVCVQEFRMHCMRHPCSPPLQFWLHSSPLHFRLHVGALHCCTQWLPAWHRISNWLCTPRCMFAHLNQNLMKNFSLRYIHERGTFDCMTDAFHLAYSHSTFARHAPLLHSVMTHCHRAQK